MPKQIIRRDAPAGNGGGSVLHKDHAIIHTAAIDVKIMRIDKRQMTQSVFRQLQEKLIFDFKWDGESSEDLSVTLRGLPWGLVRYTWSKSPEWADCYLVWQYSLSHGYAEYI